MNTEFAPDKSLSTGPAWSVGALVRAIADALAARFNPVRVEGELSGFTRAASGHCYFNLKDDAGQLRCAMFRRSADSLRFAPRDGLRVQALGRLDVYGPRGDLQLVVERLQPAGQGALYEQFLRLKAQLEAEGLFAAERKRPLPARPRRIGVVTSLGAAALRDVATALQRRVPQLPVVVFPASVQGAQAPAELCAALQTAYRAHAAGDPNTACDVLLLVRGGGSLEDLWAFNDEHLVRLLVQSPMPVICGVGHETDITLADFAADLRAPTPTAAAELCAVERARDLQRLEQLAQGLRRAALDSLDRQGLRLDRLAQRLGRPSARLQREQQRLQALAHDWRTAMRWQLERERQRCLQQAERLPKAVVRALQTERQRWDHHARALDLLDPQWVLRRGYAWLADAQGRPITQVAQTSAGAAVQGTLADGVLDLRVEAVRPR